MRDGLPSDMYFFFSICILKFIAGKLLDTLETGIEVKSNLDHLLCDRHLNGPGVFKRGEECRI